MRNNMLCLCMASLLLLDAPVLARNMKKFGSRAINGRLRGDDRKTQMEWAASRGGRYYRLPKPVSLFLPSIARSKDKSASRAAKVQLVDALFDPTTNNIGLIVKDPKAGLDGDSSGHDRDNMYEVPSDLACIFHYQNISIGKNMHHMKLNEVDRSRLGDIVFTDTRYIDKGRAANACDVWICAVSPEIVKLMQQHGTVMLQIEYGSTAMVIRPDHYRETLKNLQNVQEKLLQSNSIYAYNHDGESYQFQVRLPSQADVQDRRLGTLNKKRITSAMCIKPLYNAYRSLHRASVFLSYHIAMGIEHFFVWKLADGTEAADNEGMLALLPYVKSGHVTVMELHPEHGASGIAVHDTAFVGGVPEDLIGTHCVWNTRGRVKWIFNQIDLDEMWTPFPWVWMPHLLTKMLNDLHEEDQVVQFMTNHIRAEPVAEPKTYLDVRNIRGGNPHDALRDKTWGKSCFRPELVNIAWVHAAVHTVNDMPQLSGKSKKNYAEKSFDSVAKQFHFQQAYFLHFNARHWREWRQQEPNVKPIEMQYPSTFRHHVLKHIRNTALSIFIPD